MIIELSWIKSENSEGKSGKACYGISEIYFGGI